ncbi:hypothetical protein ILUMI_08591, partial [Ignelater luminosus]
MCLLLVAIVASITLYIIIERLVNIASYWKKRNVVHIEPWPLLGNMAPFIFGQKTGQNLFEDLYNKFPNERYVGFHAFLKPGLLIRDPELIKKIAVKDFGHFMDRSLFFVEDDLDSILSNNLVSLRGEKWRKMRTTLSPLFTSSKMKFMFELVSHCSQDFTKYFLEQDGEILNVEMKDIFSRFTTDAIATTIFGVSTDSLRNQNNEFFLMTKNMTNTGGLRALRFVGYLLIPKLLKFFNIPLFPDKVVIFFTKLIKDVIESRRRNAIIRPDMVHLFLEARKKLKNNNEEDFSDEIIIAQAVIFAFAGFENTSTIMSFMSYELAANRNIQDKVQCEIDEVLQKCEEKITYEDVSKLKYLDMVILETLRKWPAGPVYERMCVKDYEIPAELKEDKDIVIEKGTTIFIPYGPIHRDSKYFPDPMTFDPQRFNGDTNKIPSPFIFMPYGVGPRNCI